MVIHWTDTVNKLSIKVDNLSIKVENLSIKVDNLSFFDSIFESELNITSIWWFLYYWIINNLGDNDGFLMIWAGLIKSPKVKNEEVNFFYFWSRP